MFNLKKPLEINWELNNRCNLMCPQCGRNEIKDGKLQWRKWANGNPSYQLNDTDKSLETFKTVYNNIGYPVRVIRFQGHVSENILSKDFLPICKFLREETDTSIHVSTHGSANPIDWWEKLGNVFSGDPRSIVFFSLDGVGQESLENYRVGADYDKVIANAQSFIRGGGKAIWRMIIFKHNQHQVDKARELAKELGFWEFVEVHTNRRINMDKEFEYKGKKYILENQDISPEWNKAIEKNKNYNEGTDIECKAVKENQFYVDYMNRVWACYYIPNMKKLVTESEWYSEYFSKKDSLLNKTLDEILQDSFYNDLQKSWSNNALSYCKKFCSKKVGANRGFKWSMHEDSEEKQDKYLKDHSGKHIQRTKDYV